MERPLVSIIIPCFNAKRDVGAAVRSALNQTYPHREVIVVDDGSTDGSALLLKEFGDAIRFQSVPNRGGSAARNLGIKMARGKLIQFLDADDILYPEKLSRQVPLAVAEPSRVNFCDCDDLDEDGNLLPTPFRGNRDCQNVDPFVFVTFQCGLLTSSPLHWKENLEKIGGFREDLPCAQERDLHIRLACLGLEFDRLPEALWAKRNGRASVSSNLIRVLDQHSSIVRNARKLLEAAGALNDERSAAMAGLLARDARAYLKCGLTNQAMNYCRLAKELHPDGGVALAYHGIARVTRRLFGPVMTHRLGQFLKGLK
jgi:glycosyltransferase involved in cell wall biosynthesis